MKAQKDSTIISKFNFTPAEKIISFNDLRSEGIGNIPIWWNNTSAGEVIRVRLSRRSCGKFTFGYYNYYATYYRNGTPYRMGMEYEPKVKEGKAASKISKTDRLVWVESVVAEHTT